MWRSRRSLLVITGLALVSVAAFFVMSRDADAASIAECVAAHQDQQQIQIDCLYGLIEARMRVAGITEAMLLFQRIYDLSEVFAKTGCHTHAHRVGDMAYYQYYVPTRDLDSLQLEGETGACGYGFYHGFIEHLIQEHPDPAFVTETCERLDARIRPELGDIRPICYHGSGHGFMLRHVEDLPVDAWGDIDRFVEEPLARCGELIRATAREREECEEGVYNVIVEWMETKQFGFAYDYDDPFPQCDTASEERYRRACYYEVAMKLDARAKGSPARLYEMIESVDAAYRTMVFSVGIAGMVQPLADSDGFRTLVDECLALRGEYVWLCLTNVLHGLFEHGQPGEEYRKPLLVCTDSRLPTLGLEDDCYAFIAWKLPRFYDASRRVEICAEVPDAYRASCAG